MSIPLNLPSEFDYELAGDEDGRIFVVNFAYVEFDMVSRYYAGPFFSKNKADAAAAKLKAIDGVTDSSVAVWRETGVTWSPIP